MELAGAVCLVTGASSGIGRATAQHLVAQGAEVLALGRNANALEATGGRPIVCDLTDDDAVARAVASAGAVDVLVNNAGIGSAGPLAELDEETLNRLVRVNLVAPVLLTRAFLPGMLERGRGHVVNVGSVAGSYPYPGGNVYGATKAFVHQFSLNLRADLVGSGVRVTCIEPGMADTEFSLVRLKDAEKARAVYQGVTPLSAADVADAIHWVVTRPPHVNVNLLELMPEQQAFSPFAVKRR